MSGMLVDFWQSLDFTPDPFQVQAAEAIEAGESVVVTAPTGAGKTLVAEAAIHIALREHRRVFYTTPIKALSNQKYADLAKIHGSSKVGLLTGDNVVNPGAPVIVATLEVLRNMIYADPERLGDVTAVILDEAHYLQDRSRGAAWEEVIIHCPSHVRFICLSATISNNGEFAEWVEERRGPTRLVATDERPVPLESMYLIEERGGARTLYLLPTFVTRDHRRRPNPRLHQMMSLEKGRRRRYKTPSRLTTVEKLAEEGMLPAIYFIFSRAGCDTAVRRLVESGVSLTRAEERTTIRSVVEETTAHLDEADLDALGYDLWITALESGVAAHHAGLVPAFKETVEELFTRGLIKVVFATETLALGINMPARTVVLESLSKFNGESHEMLLPGDYTQLTGRAGRRGIDTRGFGVVLHSPFVRFDQVAEIASAGSHELRSSFRPTYNMTANLVANYRRQEAEALLEASFAAFQRQGELHGSEERIRVLEEQLEREWAKARCERGDISEYMSLVDSDSARPSPGDDFVSNLRSGDVVDVIGGPRDGRYAVLKRLSRKGGSRYLVLSTSGRVSTLVRREITAGSERIGEVAMPAPFRPKDRSFLETVVRRLRRLPPRGGGRRGEANASHPDHPVAACPDAAAHLAALRRARRLERRLEQYRKSRRDSGFGLVEEFRAIGRLLEELGYLDGWSLTSRGHRLRKIYNETDLLLTESVERGLLHGLDPHELTAICSVFVYEPRTDETSSPEWPTPELHRRWVAVESLWKELAERERNLRLTPTRRPDPGFGLLAYRWASGVELEDLPTRGMAPGDFVRVSRQLTDLLRQLRDAVDELETEARSALMAVDRGVVAAQGVG